MFQKINSNEYPVGRCGRGLLVAWGILLVGGFALARQLDPDPRGFGTHQRLGFPPCSIRQFFGIPCPSCGMTTSFAHFTRGELKSAMAANSAGVVLAVLCAVLVPWCWCSAWQGRLWGVTAPVKTALAVMIGIYAVVLLQWVITICL